MIVNLSPDCSRLAAHEAQSITKRVGHLMEEVRAQEEREKQLQKRFDALKVSEGRGYELAETGLGKETLTEGYRVE